ncbi:hypothetical protein BDU57DRAFT_147297 [Ampelomyces quisqualis]|uniref:Uncharacterized protein n=1 Tax=Ampelomyces quisqualis TaxID=50730 RepID=A0A6A5QW54_AMPQU|nr:hypothetical protein BDU57DRAFT_147297 [Ampelomyces quisqualis]
MFSYSSRVASTPPASHQTDTMADVEQEHRPTMSVEPPEHRHESATCEMQQPAKTIASKEVVKMPTEAPTGNMPAEPTPFSRLSVVHREDTIEATPENCLPSPPSGAAQAQTPKSPDSAVDEVDAFLSSLEDPKGADTEHISVPPTTVVAQARVPRLTPDHRLTTEELRSLRKPGDTVTTASGHKVEVLEDGRGRLLFLSQPSVVSTTNESHDEPPIPTSRPPPKKGRKRRSMITSVDLRNIIDIIEEKSEHVAVDTLPTSSMPPSTYSLRNRRATRGKLVYDVKYHPMDDRIRPTQAAKRRSAHGEIQVISDNESDTSESFSVHAESGDDEGEDDREIEEKAKPIRKGKKRARHCSTTPEPIRRSSRRTTKPKMSYNMNFHPQDQDLEVSSDNDSEIEVPSGRRKRQKISRSIEKDSSSPVKVKGRSTAVVISSEVSDKEDEESACNDVGSVELKDQTTPCEEQDNQIRMSSPLSVVTTPPPYGIRKKEGLDVWFLKPGERYFRHDKDSWPKRQRPAFDIYTERLEDQLAVEANALSPLNYDHEDKENDVTNTRSEEAAGPTDGITVIPAQYRSLFGDGDALSHHLPAMDAFYTTNRMFSPYDLGGSDGANDCHDLSTQKKSIAAAMSILASSDHLPSASDAQKVAQEPDSVCGLPSSADSVCG